MKQINYSIIIPHKNIPKLLQRCLDSIPRREDIQIIVVDDNSDPEIVNFDNFPGLNNPYIEVVFTKEGKGAGYARNVGLTKANGKWLLFADADDFFNYCINDILNEYVNSDADVIYFKHNSVYSDSYITADRGASYNAFIDYWQRKPQKAEILLRYGYIVPWAKMIKSNIVIENHIVYDEVLSSNDVTFSYLSGFYAASIHVDSRALYCTTIRQGSIRYSEKTFGKKIDEFYVSCKRYRFYKKHRIPFSLGTQYFNSLTRSWFFNKTYYNKAIDILFGLGFTKGEIVKLCIYNAFIYFPKKIAKMVPVRWRFGLFKNNSRETI